MKQSISTLLLGLTGAFGATAFGQEFHMVVDTQASTMNLTGAYSVDLDTTVIGDYDPQSNPGGTRTVPGFFGGSGNNTIPVDLGLGGTLNSVQPPTGSFDFILDLPASSIQCSNLVLDLLGGGTATSDLGAELFYQTFRSQNPDSLFVGGLTVPLPLGQQTITEVIAVQSSAALGLLTPGGTMSTMHAYSLFVPVDITMTVDFNGTPTPVGPFPASLLLAGDVDINGTDLTANVLFAQTIQQMVVDPLPGFALTDVPFGVPTILPAGSIANLLLSGSVESADFDVSLNAAIEATGSSDCGFSAYCPVTATNSTGQVAFLAISGSAVVADEDLTLTATQLPNNVFGFYLMSPAQGLSTLPAPGQGILCLGSPLYRLNQFILNSGSLGTMQLSLDFQALPPGAAFLPGSTWHFQLWHRDMNPSNTSNTSNGVTVEFCQ